jgi:DNA-binding MarR family transcriptional regulator
VDELLDEVRLTNQLLRLAFGAQIELRLAAIASSPAAQKVLTALKDQDDLSVEALQKASGMPRSSLYAAIANLERLGVIEKTRRGYVALSKAAAPYV